jgi:hypothetical protein
MPTLIIKADIVEGAILPASVFEDPKVQHGAVVKSIIGSYINCISRENPGDDIIYSFSAKMHDSEEKGKVFLSYEGFFLAHNRGSMPYASFKSMEDKLKDAGR